MWCTACNTGFSWRTGRVAEGPVHNPHYFQWLQTQGQNPHAAPAVGRVGDCEVDLDRQVAQALIPGNPHLLGGGYGGVYGARRLAALTPQNEDTQFLIVLCARDRISIGRRRPWRSGFASSAFGI